MGYEKPPSKLTFYKAFFSTQWKFLIHILIQCLSAKRTAWNKFRCSMASAVICLATSRKFNFFKHTFDNMVRNVDNPSKFLMYLRFLQVVMDNHVDDMTSYNTRYTSIALTQKVFANMQRVEKVVTMDAKHSGMINQEEVNATSKEVSAAEPTVFDDEEYDNKEENIDWNAVVEQIQERHLDNIRKYQSLKKKPVSIAQAKKNMIIYLKNMAGYKMEHLRGMAYDKVMPIFKRGYKKVQMLFKPDKDVEEPKKKRVDDETLLQESFKKLKVVKVSGSESTKGIPSNDPKEMSEEDVQNIEDLVALWNLVKEKFRSAVPSVDKEKALWVELKRLFKPDADDVMWKLQRYMHALLTWKLYTDCGVHHVSSTRGHDFFMLKEKYYPLSNGVMILMLSGNIQVEEDNEIARDLVMKIFMEANKPKSRSLDTL
nr:hypothetical protein [Tanacetum cinerariifolium]